MNKNYNKLIAIFGLFLAFFVFTSIFVSAEPYFVINAKLNGYNTEFISDMDSDSSISFDPLDFALRDYPAAPYSFLTSINSTGGKLLVESWPYNSSRQDKFNLTYEQSPITYGTLKLTLRLSNPDYEVTIQDYGNSSNYSVKLGEQTGRNGAIFSYSQDYPDGKHYFRFYVNYNPYKPLTPGGSTNPVVTGGGGGDCSDTCESLNYTCGVRNICGNEVTCGPDCVLATTCTNQCILGTKGCLGNNYRTCVIDITTGCTTWNLPTACADGLICMKATGICVPEQDAIFDFGNPQKIGPSDCMPNWQCQNWSICQFDYGLETLVYGAGVAGIKEKVCTDISQPKCYSNNVSKAICSLKEGVIVEKVIWCGENYTEVRSKADGTVLSRLKKSLGGKINVDLLAGTGYCDYCYDGFQNHDETGVDCGGSCSECRTGNPAADKAQAMKTIFSLFVLMIILIVLALLGKNLYTELRKNFIVNKSAKDYLTWKKEGYDVSAIQKDLNSLKKGDKS